MSCPPTMPPPPPKGARPGCVVLRRQCAGQVAEAMDPALNLPLAVAVAMAVL